MSSLVDSMSTYFLKTDYILRSIGQFRYDLWPQLPKIYNLAQNQAASDLKQICIWFRGQKSGGGALTFKHKAAQSLLSANLIKIFQ